MVAKQTPLFFVKSKNFDVTDYDDVQPHRKGKTLDKIFLEYFCFCCFYNKNKIKNLTILLRWSIFQKALTRTS